MKKTIVTVVCLLIAAGALYAGGGSQSSGGQAGGSSGSTAGKAEFVIGNGTEIQSIDPSQIEGVPEHRVYMALFEGLVVNDPKTNKAQPGVAESWTISADGSVITFKIRSGITWSDGTPITAQTVVDSWLHHLNPATASNYAYLPGMVVKGADLYNTQGGKPSDVAIRAVDASTFEVTLVGNVPYAIDMFAHYAFSPLPMHAINKFGSDWIKPGNFVSNGPFVLQEWIPNDHLTVVPNDKYWNKANVHLSKITFLPIEDTNTAYQAFKNGEIDWSTNIPLAIIDQLKLDKDYRVATQLGSYFYYINMNHPILKDVRLRKALSMSFDRQELIDRVVKGGQVPAFALVPPIGDYKPATGTGYDVAAAKRLLAEAGYPEGRGLPTFTIIYNTLDSHKVIAEYLQQVWKTNLGVNVTLQNLEWATFLEERKTSRMELGRAGWIADYADAQNFLDLLITGGGNNDGHYSDPEYDRLIRQASAMPGGPARDAVLRQAEEIAVTRDQAVIPIYYYVSQNIIDLDKWDGWYTNPQDTHPWVGIRKK
ncbi:MAG: peptide ABC transporter substrate-binding protein [Treponema sp.]|jgi:oligopeptide transport system substrate-binding protein|nr:peptide ABC transporter substrate-binding protein [Treponema sp.]